MNLRVIRTTPKAAKVDLVEAYRRAMANAMQEATTENSHSWLKAIYCAVKYLNYSSRTNSTSKEAAHIRLMMYESVKGMMARVTPRDMLRVFPVVKEYDGAKWEAKDYFSTMEALAAHGMDTKLGENTFEVLWDYRNNSLSIFAAGYLCAISAVRKFDGEKGIFEEFAEEFGMPLYTSFIDPATGRQYMQNSDTGETARIRRRIPRYLNLVDAKRK